MWEAGSQRETQASNYSWICAGLGGMLEEGAQRSTRRPSMGSGIGNGKNWRDDSDVSSTASDGMEISIAGTS
jgi:hypothetical protein